MIPEGDITVEQAKQVFLENVATTGCLKCGARVPYPVRSLGGILQTDWERGDSWCAACGMRMMFYRSAKVTKREWELVLPETNT